MSHSSLMHSKLFSVELFSGCGGLALGLSRAGFEHRLMVEFNSCAVATIRHNSALGVEHVVDWPVEHADVCEVNWKPYAGLDLVAGGPPCQPFSIGGKARGAHDGRDMWPQAIRAVREIAPQAFVFENVRGLMRPRFAHYLASIVGALSEPGDGLRYRVSVQLVNAADFGAAQKRHRVIISGVLGTLNGEGCELVASHSRDRLLWDQWVSGEYWRDHGIRRNPDSFDNIDRGAVLRLRKSGVEPTEKRWVTVRDCLAGLGDPDGRNGHAMQFGARTYPGHTGSPLDQPAKALKAGDHGVPGGENMMVRDDGSVRYFTVREAARLQGLPDAYEFPRSWTESMRQLGNAVPVQLSEAVGGNIRKIISQAKGKIAIAA